MNNQSTYDTMLVALDIGTTKISVLVAQKVSDEGLTVIGIGKAPSYGVSRGVVVDIAQAVHSIKLAIKEAELMAGCTIESVCIGISGVHVQAFNSQGMIPIKNGRIRPHDVSSVLAAARAVVIPEGQQILHVLPQYYTIDNHHRVADPVGMFGVRLEAQVHIVTGAVASVQNLVRACMTAGVEVSDIIFEPLASADAVLSPDEKQLGVALLDIGGGTSDFAIYQQGTIRHTKVFPIAGNLITHDIALCLRATIKDAERVKQEYGSTLRSLFRTSEQIEIEMVHGEETTMVSIDEIARIIEPRVSELLMMVHKEIEQGHLENLMPAGIVLTGGGALLNGIKETVQISLRVPARVGNPHVPPMFKEVLSSPVYATAYGLLLHTLKKNKGVALNELSGPLMNRVFYRMKSWVADFF
ncbi:cell division protein FtsA [Candidatus Dependentiae bacterium]|nr:cell division protein FtsA [Candidatus Dependentiae bacterium]